MFDAFLKLRGLNRGEPETDDRPPFGISILACLGCFALVYVVAPPGEVLFGSWWIKLLFYALLPVTVTFTIMYRSCWHPEITGVPRIFLLLLVSGLIFCATLPVIMTMLAAGCLVTSVFRPNMGP